MQAGLAGAPAVHRPGVVLGSQARLLPESESAGLMPAVGEAAACLGWVLG